MTNRELVDAAWVELMKSEISGVEWQNRVTNGYKGKPYNWQNTAYGRAKIGLDQVVTCDAPPPPSHVYPPPVLVNPRTYVVPVGATTVQLDKTQKDWILDFGWLERKSRVLVYGWDGQRFVARNGWCNIDKPVGGSAYGRGLIGVRSNDGLGPAEAYFDGMLTQGATIADAFVVDAGTKTIVTVANFRLECSRDTTGVQFSDPTEHIDQVQTQGKIGRLRLSNGTLNLSDQANPTDAGGKGLMLHKETGGPFTVEMQYVNFVGKGRNGATIFQNTRDITINIGEGVYADLAAVTSPGYAWGRSSFYPNDWTSTGTAPNRVATFGTGWTGKVLEGRPPGGDYVTRAIKP